ncbi:MAG TPA: glutathione-dependent formaldehyde dehydrogenase, partial [Chloroflexota bacterium]|nr:glutathione-dependent formaldehyde dehydrogenase [Chloroflexota bacterium]
MGQTHVHRYVKPLMEKIERGELDARFIITHRLPLSEAPRGYDLFCRRKEGCVKVVLKP